MSALTQQLEQLKKQQADLEERIKKEEETKQKLQRRITALVEKNKMLLDENDSLKQQAYDMHLGHYCYSDKEYFPASKFS
jgi:hypothetical protein